MSQSETDHWFEVTAQLERLTNAQLQAEAQRLLDMAQRSDEAKRRLALDHLPGWGGKTGRPAVGIIRCLLLIRGIQPAF